MIALPVKFKVRRILIARTRINPSWLLAFAPAARQAAKEKRGGIIHFEIMPKNINKVVDATVPLLGDVTANLALLLPRITSSPREAWFKDIRSWKSAYPFTYKPSEPSQPMKPQEVVEALDKLSHNRKEDFIITTGVGQHQMWAAQHYRWTHPRTMVTSGGLGVSRALPVRMSKFTRLLDYGFWSSICYRRKSCCSREDRRRH